MENRTSGPVSWRPDAERAITVDRPVPLVATLSVVPVSYTHLDVYKRQINANDPAQKKIADDIVAWLTANQGAMARRLGVMYLIWNRQIWGTWDIPGGWQPYSGSSPHTDHIHTSLTWDGAMKNTSWWTGVALTTWDEGPCQVYQGEPAAIYTARRIDDCPAAVAPPKTPPPSTVHGSSGTEVTTAQRLLLSLIHI